jgi:hypothetical protein
MMKGGLLSQMLMRQKAEGNDDDMPEDPHDSIPTHDDDEHVHNPALSLQLKKRRYQGLYKKLLTDAGYGDMARMVNVRHESERDDDNGY